MMIPDSIQTVNRGIGKLESAQNVDTGDTDQIKGQIKNSKQNYGNNNRNVTDGTSAVVGDYETITKVDFY